jgi:hypothetical protein
MEGFGGPAQPSLTIAQRLNGGYGWLQVKSTLRDGGQHSASTRPPAARHSDMET